MVKSELLKSCRYYDGESDNPFKSGTPAAMFWDYERIWVVRNGGEYISKNFSAERLFSLPAMKIAVASGTLQDAPRSLLSLLFDRYVHRFGGYSPVSKEAEGFVSWLERSYFSASKVA